MIKSTYDDLTNKVPGLYDHSERKRTYFQGNKKLTADVGGGIMKTEYMRAQLPKGAKDLTNPGETITAEQLERLTAKAQMYGMKFDVQEGKYGGFENYRGDVSVIEDAMHRIFVNKKELPGRIKDDTVLLRYEDVLTPSGERKRDYCGS